MRQICSPFAGQFVSSWLNGNLPNRLGLAEVVLRQTAGGFSRPAHRNLVPHLGQARNRTKDPSGPECAAPLLNRAAVFSFLWVSQVHKLAPTREC